MAQPTEREVKDALYDQFARIGKAVASPKRVEVLDLLGQGERTVEGVASATAMGLANTSAHLQALRAARLVETRKEGTRVFYRPAGDEVSRFLIALRDLASGRLSEVDRIVRDYFEAKDRLEPVSREELVKRLRRKQVVVVDVRPPEEYRAGHIPGAISVPLEDLPARLAKFPRAVEVVAYCRGPYCVLAPQALELLRASGLRARRLVDGFPEWRLAGLPVATGTG
jgi:rhodanese-related sulfurtransferase